jgi:hypothetical protein
VISNPSSFRAFNYITGVDRLESNLTINGITVAPTFRYKGGDADTIDWEEWGYGETLGYNANGGAVSVNQGSPLLGANDDSVLFDENAFYRTTDSSFADVSTEDIVFEMVFKTGALDDARYILEKRDGANEGYSLICQNTNVFTFVLDAGVLRSADSAALTEQTWYHALFFVNRDEASANGSKWYINGVASGAGVDCSAAAGSISSTALFTIGARSASDSNEFDSNIAYCAMWKQSDWHQAGASGPAEWATIAAERFQKLIGVYPQVARGTAAAQDWGSVSVRNSQAHLDKWESGVRYIYQVGDHWLRVVNRLDSTSTEINGYLSETSVENKCLQSEDMATTWSKLDAGDTVTANDAAAPNKETTADALIADTTDGDHGVTQDITLTAVTWTFSIFAKKGNKNWLYISNDTVADATCYFDLDTPALGTSGAGVTGYIEDWGNGWCRCAIVFTGTAAAHTFKVQTADADGDKTVTGDGSTKNTYLWGGQAEIGEYMTSYVPTVASATTRNADTLRYKGDDGNLGGVGSHQTGTLLCSILLKDYNSASDKYICTLSDGGASADRLTFRAYNTNVFRVLTAASGGNAGDTQGATDIYDDTVHTLRSTWQTNSLSIYVDSTAEGTPDTSIDIADNLDRIDIGQSQISTAQLNGVISNLRIWSFPTLKS